ncbi:MAG: DUF370 domain-containing protein [Eubacteriales bacterium]|nr:DUF370 domain-containing protein [Eubacteriales bacterium]
MQEQKNFLSCGFGSFVSLARLIAVVVPEAAPIRRLIQEARERGALVDATAGRKTKSVLIMDTDQVILSALPPESLLADIAEETEAE